MTTELKGLVCDEQLTEHLTRADVHELIHSIWHSRYPGAGCPPDFMDSSPAVRIVAEAYECGRKEEDKKL